MDYADWIARHYQEVWDAPYKARRWPEGPMKTLRKEFCVLEFPETPTRNLWTYATCCMSAPIDDFKLELHLFAPEQSAAHIELLTVIAHYHITGHRLGLHHTVNFGRPWVEGSACDHGFISLPYLDGPRLEKLEGNGMSANFLWLIPITRAEVEFKKIAGADALEAKFDEGEFNYIDATRRSVI